ncbi:MAG: hypothetical protein J2O46_00370 [Nocardioides sp.]|nr:hypothetical protein [Nocardioides sp.]
MLVASLALVVTVASAVIVGRSVLEQRRLRRSLADIWRTELFAATAVAESDRAAAWLTTVTDPITKPITRPLADATQTVRGSVAGALAKVLRGRRSAPPATLVLPAAESTALAELGRGVDEAVLDRRSLTADLSDDETMSFGLVDE